ncbi:TPA: hypothetical protein OFX33_003447 [Escherichia coli]|nr:hypothetical protein [Escherichia coli]
MFSEVMRYILDLGPTVMLPIVIIIFSKILGMKAGDCFKAGLHIGIGFVGIGLVIGLMLDSIGPAAKAMAVAVHRGNLFRTLISGVIIMSITLWIATQTIGLHTQLAANAGALKAGGMVASMDQGGSPITWLLIQVFSPQNIPGFIIIGAIYLTGIFMTWRRARGFIKQEKVVLAE